MPTDDFIKKYKIQLPEVKLEPRYNVAPGAMMPVIVKGEEENTVKSMKWGLIPFWAKDPKIGYKMINARAEDIDKKPSFRKPIKTQRCLVPASGFYEWKKTDGGKSIPYYFYLKNQKLFSFAGLFDVWKDAEGYPLYTYTIITTQPNEVVSPVHNRMPAILSPDDEQRWSDNSISDPEKILPLIKPYSTGDMETYEVSTLVNTPFLDSPNLIQKVI